MWRDMTDCLVEGLREMVDMAQSGKAFVGEFDFEKRWTWRSTEE